MATPERIISLGPDHFGIYHDTGRMDRPTIIFINAGVVHRVGPHRLYVKMARAFAELGFSCLRFDLSGLGDAPPGQKSYEEQALSDIKNALSQLRERSGIDGGVILLGLCSGSEHAYKVALGVENVRGLILLDPHSYPSPLAKLERAAQKATDISRVGRKIGNLIRPGQDRVEVRPDEPIALIDRPDPPREVWAADLQTLIGKGIQLYIRYTRYVEEDLTRPEHFFHSFKDVNFRDQIRVDVDGQSDHTSTPLQAQARLIEQVGDWLEQWATHEQE
ncbi:MAG: alpha/beta fold hydrolase [Parvularcula sp.]